MEEIASRPQHELPSEDAAHLASTFPLAAFPNHLLFFIPQTSPIKERPSASRGHTATCGDSRGFAGPAFYNDRASREICELHGTLSSNFYADPSSGCVFTHVRLHAGMRGSTLHPSGGFFAAGSFWMLQTGTSLVLDLFAPRHLTCAFTLIFYKLFIT